MSFFTTNTIIISSSAQKSNPFFRCSVFVCTREVLKNTCVMMNCARAKRESESGVNSNSKETLSDAPSPFLEVFRVLENAGFGNNNNTIKN